MATNTVTFEATPEVHAALIGLPDAFPAVNCETYNQYKSVLQIALRLIPAIPVYGAKIATALQFLMGIADQLCPAPAAK